MNHSPSPSSPKQVAEQISSQISGALEWWEVAGVSHDFSDEAEAWFKDEVEEAPALAPTPKQASKKSEQKTAEAEQLVPLGGGKESWPKDLATFRTFWLEEKSLDDGGTHPRIASRGEAGAKLLVLVPMPENTDSDILLGGKQGVLVSNMTKAMGYDAAEVGIIAALPRHMASPDWAGLGARGLGDLLEHHIGLAAPERLIVLGRGILPLLQHDPAQAPATIKQTSIQGTNIPSLAGFAPERLLQHAKSRAGLWKRWLEWTGTE